jgi:hypothetical protein
MTIARNLNDPNNIIGYATHVLSNTNDTIGDDKHGSQLGMNSLA